MGAETVVGYLETRRGHFDVFFVGVNGASAAGIEGVLEIGDDVARVAAHLQEASARRR